MPLFHHISKGESNAIKEKMPNEFAEAMNKMKQQEAAKP